MTRYIPNYGEAAFIPQSYPDGGDFDIIVEAFSGTGVVSGCAVAAQGVPNMTVAVAAGTVLSQGTILAVAAGNVTIGASDPLNPRIDLIVADSAGNKQNRPGVAAPVPLYAVPSLGDVVLAAVWVDAAVSSIVAGAVLDKRVTITPVFDTTPPTTSAVGDVAAPGTGTFPAHRNHIHGREGFAAPVASAVSDTGTPGTALTVPHSDHKHPREGFGSPVASAVGDAGSDGTATTVAHSDHKHPRESFAIPAISLGTAAGAGAATTHIRSDATIVAFDATLPAASAVGDAGTVGSVGLAARRDHQHPRESFGTTAAAIGTASGGSATTLSRSDHVHPTGAGTPSTQAFGDAAAIGTGPAAAMFDHKHAMPASPAAGKLKSITVLTVGSGTYTVPAGITTLFVTGIGGGGAGGGAVATSGQSAVGAGGGGGAYAARLITSPLTSYPYTVGAGGTGVTGASGNAGQNTSFGAGPMQANGGGGGGVTAAGTGFGVCNGGTAGTGMFGDFFATGSDGTNGQTLTATSALPGSGGAAAHGGGQRRPSVTTTTVAGAAGNAPGGGGSGALNIGSQAGTQPGGAGADGTIVIYEYGS